MTVLQFNADVKIGFYESLLDGDAQMLRSMFESGRYDGIVVAGFGAGHVSGDEADIIERYVSRIPVVVASRTYGGRPPRRLMGSMAPRLIFRRKALCSQAGYPRKARLLLWALLAAGKNLEETRANFLLYNP
ncbi:hypothetical protein VXQ18_01640 [Brucella abortus]|nr:hypothetical protein [Brucella abortus]